MLPVPSTTFLPIEALPEWQATLNDVAGQLAESSRRVYVSDARFFATWLANQSVTSIGQITRSHVIAYRVHLRETRSKATANRMLSVVRRLLNEQVLAGHLPANPAEQVPGFRGKDDSPYKALTKREIRALMEEIPTDTKRGLRDRALLRTLLKTGMRRAELAALNLGDLDMEQGHHIAIIRHGKGDKRRIVKLSPDVFRDIQLYINGTGRADRPPDAPLFVAVHRGDWPLEQRLSTKGIEWLVQQYGKKIGLDLSPHNFRASFITLSLEDGAPLQKVQRFVGHADPRMTLHYQDRKDNLDDAAVDYLRGI